MYVNNAYKIVMYKQIGFSPKNQTKDNMGLGKETVFRQSE
jgi:hypothetical protein